MSRMVANILMCCAALFWGATFIAQKTGMETIGPMGFTFGRYVIGALALLPLAIHETGKTNLLQAMGKDKRLCVGALCLGVFMFGGIGLQQTALLYTNVANAAFLTAFYVPLVPLIAALFLRRHIPLNIWPCCYCLAYWKLSSVWDLQSYCPIWRSIDYRRCLFLGWSYPVDTMGYEPNKRAVSIIASAIDCYRNHCGTFYGAT